MLQKISSLGTLLNKKEQSQITGGYLDNEEDCLWCEGTWNSQTQTCTVPNSSPCSLYPPN